MAKDPHAELERLARRGSQRARRQAEANAPPTLTPQEEAAAAALRRRSLAEPGWGDRAIKTANLVFFVLILVAGFASPALLPAPERLAPWLLLAITLLAWAGAWVAAFLFAPEAADLLVAVPLARRQLGRLQQLPFSWDQEGYLAELARQRKWATLRVVCVIRPPCDAPTRALFLKAARGLLPKLKARIHDEPDGTISLTLTKDDLEGYATIRGRYGRAGAYFTNAAIHDVFRQVAFELLPQVSALCPIERVTVTVEGDVVPMALSPDDVGR